MLYQAVTFKIPTRLPILENVAFYFGVGALFLGCSNIFSWQGYFVLASLIFFAISSLASGKLFIGVLPIGALLFGGAYLLGLFLSHEFSAREVVYHLLMPAVFIQLCYRTALLKDKTAQKKRVLSLVSSIIIGLFVAFCFYLVATIKRQGLYFASGYVTSFWESYPVNRTGLSLYCVGAVSACSFLIFTKNALRKPYTIIGSAIIIILTVVTEIIVGNRSFLIVILALAIFWILYGLRNIKKKWVLFLLVASTVGTLLLGVLVYIGIIPLPDFIMRLPIIQRIIDGGSNAERLLLYKEFFTNFYKYPLGGVNAVMTRHYVHNLFLDFYTYGGVISFALVCGFTARTVFNVRRLQKIGALDSDLRVLLYSFAVGLLALGLLEPIYQANSLCVWPILIIAFYFECLSERYIIPTRNYKI